MSLSEIMSAAKLHGWAEVGLVLFLFLFALVVVHLLRRRNRATFERARALPLDDGELAPPEKSRDDPS